MAGTELLYLSKEDIVACITMQEVIEANRNGFIQLSKRNLDAPDRLHMDVAQGKTTALIMPVFSEAVGSIGLKMATLCRDNPDRGLPLLHALVLLMDGTTGVPLAVMDGGIVTALRTGAASGVATDLLARNDAAFAAVFGAGVQARTQLQAVVSVRSIRRVAVFDPIEERARTFAEEMEGSLSIRVGLGTYPEDVERADIIITATTSAEPVFEDRYVREGTHINAIGSYKPAVREVPSETVA